ncbi:hypothetical protein B0A50_02661 [Salinomyces thailandicus]|uniref:H/ACA ribonucleoprotein complex non-core subunit NAF1 n=1 Tax=Salinomyces thailandicus TaxID=706561 RepID=A0A4U0U642_9PEZI|nr:hypothetical protein B0A50_02661 [Salinomyces thailandica]
MDSEYHADPADARPTKRVRLDAPLEVTEDVQEEIIDDEGWDEIYGTTTEPEDPQTRPTVMAKEANTTSEVAELPSMSSLPLAPPEEHRDQYQSGADDSVRPEQQEKDDALDGVPPEAVAEEHDDVLVPEPIVPNAADEASVRMLAETSSVNGDPSATLPVEDASGQTNASGEMVQPVENESSLQRPEQEMSIERRDEAAVGETVQEPDQEVRRDGQVSDGDGQAVNGEDRLAKGDGHAMGEANQASEPQEDLSAGLLEMLEAKPEPSKATEDPEFMAAAATQKEQPNAEWQFDSSDAESSNSSDSDDDSDDDTSSDSSSDGGYEMLDPATAAKMLMAGEGDDDDDGKKGGKGGADRQPRTANEVREEVVPKPDIQITEEMKITELGTIENTVEGMVLIKGATPGEYQVLEAGSVLCNEKRDVIGAVAETFGRVEAPMYSVAFTNAQEIEEFGLKHASKVFYVDAHSTFVFTQPLKNLKGTDASNLHDEEIAEEEMEFSDDEAEMEFKRQKKMAKKAARGGYDGAASSRGGRGGGPRSFGAPGQNNVSTFIPGGFSGDAPQATYGGGMSYDDEDVQEEFYNPLKRPPNLSELMASGGPPPMRGGHGAERGARGGGRGRGDRGRGRGDRGRGRGGFNQDRNSRGGRGGSRGGDQQSGGQYRGNAHSFPDRHNDDRRSQSSSKPFKLEGHSSSPPQQQTLQHQQQPQPQAFPALNPYRQQDPQQSSYQFNGYQFQYGSGAPTQIPAPQHQAQYYAQQPQQLPVGAYANPAYYSQQAPVQPQWPAQQTQPQYNGWAGQQGQTGYTQPGAPAPTAEQQMNLMEILRRMGGNAQ